MTYILDTNICIQMLKDKSFNILRHAKNKRQTEIYISCITEAELWYGVWNSTHKEANKETLKRFLQFFPKLKFESTHAESFGQLKAEQRKNGRILGPNDLLIAAQALDLDATLVTANEKEFKQIKGLKIENWLRATP